MPKLKRLFHIYIPPDRNFGLDLLRALAILFVVGRHSSYLLPRPLYNFINFFLHDGVSIFFVLSGFLIGGILLRLLESEQPAGKLLAGFWKRRWLRTLPNYFFILLLLCGLHFFFTDDFSIRSVASYFIFSQNLFYDHPLWFFSEAWSLSIEEWFYLLTPLLLVLLTRVMKITPRVAVLTTAFLVIFAVTAGRYVRYETLQIQTIDEWDLIFRKQVISRLDSLMFGVLGAWLHYYFAKTWLRYKLPLLIAGLFLFIFTKFVADRISSETGLYNCVFSFHLVSLATLLTIPYLLQLRMPQGIFFKIITITSLISYSMYLVNLSLVKNWIIDRIDWTTIFSNSYLLVICKYGLFWILTLTFSILLYKYLERPVMDLRDKR